MTKLPEIDGFFISKDDEDQVALILARWFANANSDDQQRFIEEVCKEVGTWDRLACFQWAFLKLSKNAKDMVADIAEHSQEYDA